MGSKGLGGINIPSGGSKPSSSGMGIAQIMPFVSQMAMMNTLQQKAGAQQQQMPNTYAMGGTQPFTGVEQKSKLGLVNPILQKQEEEKQQLQVDLQKVANVLSNATSIHKASFLEKAQGPYTKNIPSFGIKGWDVGGPIKGSIAEFAGKMGSEDYSYSGTIPGQAESIVLALSPILTGQNRVIEGITQRLQGIVSGAYSTPGTLANKNAVLMKDVYHFARALSNRGYTKENLAALSDEEANDPNSSVNKDIANITVDIPSDPELERVLDPYIQQINSAPAARKYTLPFPEMDALKSSQGRMKVIDNATGKRGTISASNFDPQKYTRIK